MSSDKLSISDHGHLSFEEDFGQIGQFSDQEEEKVEDQECAFDIVPEKRELNVALAEIGFEDWQSKIIADRYGELFNHLIATDDSMSDDSFVHLVSQLVEVQGERMFYEVLKRFGKMVRSRVIFKDDKILLKGGSSVKVMLSQLKKDKERVANVVSKLSKVRRGARMADDTDEKKALVLKYAEDNPANYGNFAHLSLLRMAQTKNVSKISLIELNRLIQKANSSQDEMRQKRPHLTYVDSLVRAILDKEPSERDALMIAYCYNGVPFIDVDDIEDYYKLKDNKNWKQTYRELTIRASRNLALRPMVVEYLKGRQAFREWSDCQAILYNLHKPMRRQIYVDPNKVYENYKASKPYVPGQQSGPETQLISEHAWVDKVKRNVE
jgi:hypothetical protein